MPWISQGSGRFIPTPTRQPFPPVPVTLSLLPPGARIVDVGAGGTGRRTRRLAELVASLLLTPHKYPDRFLLTRTHAHDVAAGVYFVGRKTRD
jgi:hypothetical protein